MTSSNSGSKWSESGSSHFCCRYGLNIYYLLIRRLSLSKIERKTVCGFICASYDVIVYGTCVIIIVIT